MSTPSPVRSQALLSNRVPTRIFDKLINAGLYRLLIRLLNGLSELCHRHSRLSMMPLSLLACCIWPTSVRAQILNLQKPATLDYEEFLAATAPLEDNALVCATEGALIYAAGYSGISPTALRIACWDSTRDTVLWNTTVGGLSLVQPTELRLTPGLGPVLVLGNRMVIACDRNSGTILWQQTLPIPDVPGAQNFNISVTASALSGDGQRLFVTLGPLESNKWSEQIWSTYHAAARLDVLDVATGSVIKSAHFSTLTNVRDLIPFSDADSVVGVGRRILGLPSASTSLSGVESLEFSTGNTNWTQILAPGSHYGNGAFDGTVDASGTTLFVVGSGDLAQLTALDLTSGASLWETGIQNLELRRLILVDGDPVGTGVRQGIGAWSGRWDQSGNLLWELTGEDGGKPRGLVLSGSRVLIPSLVQLFTGAPFSERIDAIDPISGEALWSAIYPGSKVSAPYSAMGTLAPMPSGDFALVGATTDSLEVQQFTMQRRDSANGTVLSAELLGGSAIGTTSLNDAVLGPDGEHVYMLVRSTGLVTANSLHCIRAHDGTTKYSVSLYLEGTSSYSTPRLNLDQEGDQLFIATPALDPNRAFLTAYASADGTKLWQVEIDDLPTSEKLGSLASSHLSNLVILVTALPSGQRIRCFAQNNGQLMWSVDTPPESFNTSASFSHDGLRVYRLSTVPGSGTASNDPQVTALDSGTGQVQWSQYYSPPTGGIPWDTNQVSHMLLSPDGTSLYLAGVMSDVNSSEPNHQMLCVQSADGELQWRTVKTNLATYSNPSLELAGIACSPDGSKLFVGATERPPHQFGPTVSTSQFTGLSFAADDGLLLWHKQVHSHYGAAVRRLHMDPGGSKLYFVGDYFNMLLDDEAENLVSHSSTGLIAIDSATGTRLWEASGNMSSYLFPNSSGSRMAFDPDGEHAILFSNSQHIVQSQPKYRIQIDALNLPRLCSFPGQLSLAQGGTQEFLLAGGGALGGHIALLLGSITGTAPGIPLLIGVLPLVPDVYFDLTLLAPNQPPLSGTLGPLDVAGQGRASLRIPANTAPSLAGMTLHHAWVSFAGDQITGLSNSIPLLLKP